MTLTTIESLFAELAEQGARVLMRNGRLYLDAPDHTDTAELAPRVRAHRAELMSHLSSGEESSIATQDVRSPSDVSDMSKVSDTVSDTRSDTQPARRTANTLDVSDVSDMSEKIDNREVNRPDARMRSRVSSTPRKFRSDTSGTSDTSANSSTWV